MFTKKTYILQGGVAKKVERSQVDLPIDKISISVDEKEKNKIDD